MLVLESVLSLSINDFRAYLLKVGGKCSVVQCSDEMGCGYLLLEM